MNKNNYKGCAAHGAVFYCLTSPAGTHQWFTTLQEVKSAKFDAYRDTGDTRRDYVIERVTLTARLTPKQLALALLNGEGYVATREKVPS